MNRDGVTLELKSAGPTTHGLSLMVGGADLSRIARRLTLQADANDVITANVEVLALNGLDVSLSTQVTVNVVALPGYELRAYPQNDGTVRYRVEKEPHE